MSEIAWTRALWLAAAAATAPVAPAGAQTAAPASASKLAPPVDLIAELRLREEFVDQAGLPENAAALTARARLGVDARITDHLRGLVEVEGVVDLNDSFNSTVND